MSADPPVRRRRRVADDGAGAFTDAELALAPVVRAAYIEARGLWQSLRAGTDVPYRPPARYDGQTRPSLDPEDAGRATTPPVWCQLARWLLANDLGAVVDEYVRFVFEQTPPHRPPPEPLALMRDDLRAAFLEQHRCNSETRVVTQSRSDCRAVLAAVAFYESAFDNRPADPVEARGRAYANVLLTTTVSVSPLFRHVLARSLAAEFRRSGHDDWARRFASIARYWFPAAARQYVADAAAYDRYWSAWLPARFRDEVRSRESTYDDNASDRSAGSE